MNKPYNRLFSTNDFLSLFSFFVFIICSLWGVESIILMALAALSLGLAIASSVHSADSLAKKVGPSWGTLILAIAVTTIEVALILNLMSNKSSDSSTIARDTVFSSIMIVTNGIIGICILLGGLKYRELGFKPMGTSALLSVLAVLSVLTFVLPNFTTSVSGPYYSTGQLVFVSLVSLVLYACLVWAQTKSLKSYFDSSDESTLNKFTEFSSSRKNIGRTLVVLLSMLLSLIAVVGLAKSLSPKIEWLIFSIGAPKTFVGIVIAILVLAPETFAAINAAKTNQLQTSLNLALGSGVASIALTVPFVSLYSILSDTHLSLGTDAKSNVFLLLTFLSSCFTFGSGRATALHGLVHVVIMMAYLALSFMP